MSLLSFFILPFLCTFSVLSPTFSLQCNDKQYAWPYETPTNCCDKCPPGHFMTRDPDISCYNKCEPCKEDQYRETYNVKTQCKVCNFCSYPNMERKTNCTATHNAVCGCKAGYRCTDQPCTMCVRIPTTKPTTPPPTTGVPIQPKPNSKDKTVWFLVITGLLCAVILLVIATKIRPLLHWLKSRHDFLPEKAAAAAAAQPLSQEEGDVSKPVQEVCGECEQLTDICVKD